MALSDHKRRLPAVLATAAAMFALAACDDQNTAQRDDTNAPRADQQLGELPTASPNPAPAEPDDN